MTTSGGFDAGELHIDGAPASSHRALNVRKHLAQLLLEPGE